MTTLIAGELDNRDPKRLSCTDEGHLEVAVHSPRLPFGAVNTENLTPIFQTDAVYGLNSNQVAYGSTGSGQVTNGDSLFVCSTGTTVNSQAQLQSRKRLRYRPGQGVIGRFAGIFSTPAASSYQVIGLGHAEDGFYFGYKGTDFGILYNNRGVREVQTLTITTASSTTENITIKLAGTAYTVAVTNSGNIQRTVWEISQGTYAGWKAMPSGATVIFLADSVGDKTGLFEITTASTAVGTFAETKAGVAATEIFVKQTDWNGDKLNGFGASGITLNTQKGNVYQISIQYLGFGAISFQVEACGTNKNNADFINVHTLKLPNTLTTTSVGNPAFPFTMAVYSAGSTTDLQVKVGSFAGFIEGQKKLHGNRLSYFNQLTTVGAANYHALFTIYNSLYYGGRSNQSVINLLSVSGALKHTSPTIFYLIKNGSLVGNPNFAQYTAASCSWVDSSATTVTFSNNDQLLWTGHLGDTGEIDHHFSQPGLEELTIQPGEWFTLAAKASTGTPAYVTGSINTREDQ